MQVLQDKLKLVKTFATLETAFNDWKKSLDPIHGNLIKLIERNKDDEKITSLIAEYEDSVQKNDTYIKCFGKLLEEQKQELQTIQQIWLKILYHLQINLLL